jgi:hypothetical protein
MGKMRDSYPSGPHESWVGGVFYALKPHKKGDGWNERSAGVALSSPTWLSSFQMSVGRTTTISNGGCRMKH